MVDGRRRAAQKPTWLRRLPPIRVGWSGCKVERSLMSVHGYLTWERSVSAASDEPGRQAGLTRACVSWACVRRRTRGCARGYWCVWVGVCSTQHMRGRHSRRAFAHAHEHMIDGALQPAVASANGQPVSAGRRGPVTLYVAVRACDGMVSGITHVFYYDSTKQ